MIHGLMMAAAIDAAAPSDADVRDAPRSDSFGRAGSVVLGEVVAARAASGGIGALGGTNQLTAGWFSFSSAQYGGTSIRSVSAEPSLDVFVAHGVSLGGVLGVGVTSHEATASTPAYDRSQITMMPRIGDAIEVTEDISIWPRFAAGVTLNDGTGQLRMGAAFRATFDVPVVFRLTRHVALQAGPFVSYFNQLSGEPEIRLFSAGGSGGLSILL